MATLVFKVFEDEGGGYYARAHDGPHDLYTQGGTLDELRRNLDETTQQYLESLIEETGQPIPEGIGYTMIFNGRVRIPA